jgi:acetyl-CoA acyltransferase
VPYPVIERSPDLATMQVRLASGWWRPTKGRAPMSLAALAKLKPVFAARGSVTAGNSSQMSDGAGAVLLMSERRSSS